MQRVQDPPLGPLDPMLHVQSLGAWLPDGDDDREGQLEHVLDVVAPEIVEYVPPAQRAQEAEPGEILYVPAVQIVQDPPSGPLDPLLHVQSLRASLPDGDDDWEGQLKHMLAVVAPEIVEYLPMPQLMHVLDEPGEILYMPATHSEHGPPSGPSAPALQVQAVAMRLPTGELEFDGQVSHVASPVLDLKVPAPHDVHVPPSGPE